MTPLAVPDMGKWYPKGGNHGPKSQTQQGGNCILRRNPSPSRHVPEGNRNPRRLGPPERVRILGLEFRGKLK